MSLAELEQLLAIQARDTTLDQLRHRRATLPERAELEARTAELKTQEIAHADVTRARDQVAAEEKRLDDEARTVEGHAADVDKKLYSGAVTSPRELQAMQADLEMLRRRQSDLEDQELEVMEQRETLDTQQGTLDAVIATLRTEADELRAAIAATEAEIDAEIAVEAEARAGLAAGVAASLLADYEKRRAQNRGTGAARLTGMTCGACHLTIPSTEAERIRRAEGNEIAYCDNCGAILVP
jgi:predicted  nucleic acid-binding Zn-ribbon protein